MNLRLKLIKKIAERLSYEMLIDWGVSDQELDLLETTHGNAISAFEEILEEDPAALDYETADAADHIMENMLNSYIITSLVERRKKIEEIIRQSSI